MGKRWLGVALGGGAIITVALASMDVILPETYGLWRAVLWPADLLLWATGPGVPLSNGKYEWTPIQDFSIWLGVGISWAFWSSLVRLAWILVRRKALPPAQLSN
jgi:hypothetical protein